MKGDKFVGFCPNIKSTNLRKRRRKITRKSVLKMLAVMEAQQPAGPSTSGGTTPTSPENATHTQEFQSSGRTGRRNALPDILGEHSVVSASDLPRRLQALTTEESKDEECKAAETKDTNKPSKS